ncbi:hypothetical protein CAEBREN_03648 [Caenorhabditis brenneri]|uniref:G-protein coupled receptors family 1 profile domain-containing protein n=1 Tax=Caenorhabditis brenneri TaxID=135651 RepID=G0MY14_CAEBE|nr:hypothetical protein CAEBREN_03648 [Caenorhabditis brenneri]
MANELNCAQFSVPYPDPGINGSVNLTVPLFITRIATAYRPYHYYLLSFIVIFSFLSNVCIVMVLSKKEMRTSGVNITMLLIAVCDFGCSVSGLTQLFLRIYSSESEEDGIFLVISEFSLTNNCLFLRISLVASGLGFKIAPCVLMIILSVSLLDEMNKGKISSHNTTNNSRNDKEDKLDRSSRFIQVVLVVFLLTESPQGLFNIVGGLDVIDYIK